MTLTRKDYVRLPGKSNRYALKTDPSITLSRRQYDKQIGKLKEEGFTSYEQRSKVRSSFSSSLSPITIHKKYFQTEAPDALSIKNFVRTLPKNAWVIIIAYGTTRFYGENTSSWLTVQEQTMQPWAHQYIVENANKMFSTIVRVVARWKIL